MQVNTGNAGARQMTLRSLLANSKLQDGQELEEFCATLHGMTRDLRASGAVVTIREMNQWLLNGLPEEYSSQVSQALSNPLLMDDTLALLAFLQQRELAIKTFRPGTVLPKPRYADHEYYLAMRQTNTLLPSLLDKYKLPAHHPAVQARVYNQSAENRNVSFGNPQDRGYQNRGRDFYRGRDSYRSRSPYRGRSPYRSRSPYRNFRREGTPYRSRSRTPSRSRSRSAERGRYDRPNTDQAKLNLHTERNTERREHKDRHDHTDRHRKSK